MKDNKKNVIGRNLLYLWLVCAIFCLLNLIYVIFVRKDLYNTTSSFLVISFLTALLVGSFSFALGIYLRTWSNYQSSKKRPASILALLTLPIYPLYLLIRTIKSYFGAKFRIFDRRNGVVIGSLVLGVIWLGGYAISLKAVGEVLGFNQNFSTMMDMQSMNPTIPGGSGYKNHTYKNIWYKIDPSRMYQFKRGDIISFSSAESRRLISINGMNNYDLVKRIVAIPGDTVEIKGGLLFVNNEAVDERYTLKPNSTYIPEIYKNEKMEQKPYLNECHKMVVPEKTLFVLGDNRENSDDSRLIGLVGFDDVVSYMTYEEQQTPYYEGVNQFLHSKDWRADSSLSEGIIEAAIKQCQY